MIITNWNISYEDSLELKDKIYVDIRSPLEYSSETIPGAINLYLFTDEERRVTGETYVHQSTELAKKKGIQFVSKRLPDLVSEILELEHRYKNIVIFCSRGGYRSKSLTGLLNSLDIKVYRLVNGYKGYRKYIRENLERLSKSIKPIVLYGNTGCGKTKILHLLKKKDILTIDLEALANHRGSILGHVGLKEQPSQKMFESLLFEELYKYRDRWVFVEGESSKIGRINLPKSLMENMRNSYTILIKSPMEHRVSNLVEEYGQRENKTQLIASLKKLQGYISKENIEKLIDRIEKGELSYVARLLCENYYDKRYKKRDHDDVLENLDEEESANLLIKLYSIMDLVPKIMKSK